MWYTVFEPKKHQNERSKIYMIIDISTRHANSKYNAEDIKKVLTDLGWKHLSTTYYPNDFSWKHVLGCSFVWNSPSKPIYPENIAYQIIS